MFRPRSLVATGIFTLMACANDSPTSTPPPQSGPAVAHVSIATPTRTDLAIKDTLALRATVTDLSGGALSDASVAWSTFASTTSSRLGHASVDSHGRLVGDSTGYVWVRAASGSHADSILIYVHAPIVLSLPRTPPMVAVGSHGTFTVGASDSSNTAFYPSNSIPFAVSSSDTSVAIAEHVRSSATSYFGGVTFDVRGVRDGNAKIAIVVGGVATSISVQVFTATFSSIAPSNGYLLADGFGCGLTPTGAALCWGDNEAGQLGVPTAGAVAGSGGQLTATYAPSVTPVFVDGNLQFRSLALGRNYTCGVTLTDDPYCWGDGAYLGTDASLSECIDNGYYALADIQCAPRPVPVSGEHKFRNLAVTNTQTCGIDRSGASYCWGTGALPRPLRVAAGFAFDTIAPGGGFGAAPTCGLTQGKAYCWSDTSLTAAPQLVSGVPTLSSIGASGFLDCGLSTVGQVYCWKNDLQATLVATDQRFQSLSVGYDTWICGLTAGGALYCWGGTVATPTAVVDPSLGAVAFTSIRAGSSQHACGTGRDGNAYCTIGVGIVRRIPSP